MGTATPEILLIVLDLARLVSVIVRKDDLVEAIGAANHTVGRENYPTARQDRHIHPTFS